MKWLDGITNVMDKFKQALRVDDGQGSLEHCSPWGSQESDMTERLNTIQKRTYQLMERSLYTLTTKLVKY